MPAMHAAELAALDALYQRRAIFIDDHRAGQEFAFLARRCGRRHYLPLYLAALDVLDRSGGRAAVDAVVIRGRMPRMPSELDRLQDGLDALATHFRAEGLL